MGLDLVFKLGWKVFEFEENNKKLKNWAQICTQRTSQNFFKIKIEGFSKKKELENIIKILPLVHLVIYICLSSW